MGSIFISYSKKDVVYAAKLVNALKEEGFSVWIDLLDLQNGTQWDLRLERELKDCDLYLLIVSRNSYSSSWVRKEVLFAETLNKPIFPLMIEETEPWLAIMDKQNTKVEKGAMPPEAFYARLARVTARDKLKAGDAPKFKSVSTSSTKSAKADAPVNNSDSKDSWMDNILSKAKHLFQTSERKK